MEEKDQAQRYKKVPQERVHRLWQRQMASEQDPEGYIKVFKKTDKDIVLKQNLVFKTQVERIYITNVPAFFF